MFTTFHNNPYRFVKSLGLELILKTAFFFRFVAGHPRNDLMQDNTYLAVEKYNAASKSWTTVLRDNDWETEFEWIRTNTILGKYFFLTFPACF